MLGYQSRNSIKERRRWRRIYLVTGVLGVLLLAQVIPSVFTAVSATVLLPADYLQRWLRDSEAGFPVWFRDRAQLLITLEELRMQTRSAQTIAPAYASVRAENKVLRDLLRTTSSPRVVAGVIALPGTLPYDMIQIDRGTAAGIPIGAPVFIGENQVIGSVVSVTDQYSLVQPVSSPGVVSTVFIAGADVFASLEGMGGGVARVSVPHGVRLSVGDPVMLMGSQLGYYGTIAYIEHEPTQPEQFGYVTTAMPLRGRATVAVGLESIPPLTRVDIERLGVATSSPWYNPLLLEYTLVYVGTSTASSTLVLPTL